MKICEQSNDEHAKTKLILERWIWIWPVLGIAGFATEFMQIGHDSSNSLNVQNNLMFNVAWSMALGGIPATYAAFRLPSWICGMAGFFMLGLSVLAIGFSCSRWGLI
jgi:hypothetical protein